VVLDSDGAQLIGYSPEAGRWGGWLMLERIIGHLDPAALPYVYGDENGQMEVGEGEDYQRRFRRALFDCVASLPLVSGASCYGKSEAPVVPVRCDGRGGWPAPAGYGGIAVG
jgi:hypothetical protein